MGWPERVAVVGSGPAGLSAAWALTEAGRAVTVFEERPSAGGRMRSDAMDGASVDVAVQLLSSTYGTVLGMAEALGAAGRIVRAPGRDALWRKGRPHGITYGSVSSMITSSALPASLKLRLAARYLPFLGAEAKGLDANDPAGTGGARFDDASIAAWGGDRLGEDFVELLAYPLLAAYYGGRPEDTSAAMYHAIARVGLDVKVLAVRGGMGALMEDLAAALEARGVVLRRGTRVEAARSDGDGVCIVAGDEERFDAAVLAVPATRVPALVDPGEALRRWLEEVRVVPTATLALLIDGRPDVDFFGLSFPRRETPGDRLVALCVESRKASDLVPPGREVLVAFPSPELAPELAAAEPSVVVDTLLPAIEQVFPGTKQRVQRARVHRFPDGYTLFHPGYLRHLETYREDWLPRSIVLAGDYLVAPTVEGAMVSGRRAATSLVTPRSPEGPE